MSARMPKTVDGTPVSDTDIARMRAEEQLHSEWQRRTVRVVAASASDAQDCRMLLSILGIDAKVVAQARAELPKGRELARSVRKPTGRTTTRTAPATTVAHARGGATLAKAPAAKARGARSHAA